MQLEISYRTEYAYAPAVRGGITALRLRPISRGDLNVQEARLTVSPGQVTASYVDAWGTQVDLVEAGHVHGQATFEVSAKVETRVSEQYAALPDDEAHLFARDSSRVRIAAVAGLGWSLGGEGSSWDAIESVLRWIPQRFVFTLGATDAETEIEEAIERGVGVCQDFAHIFLALLRGWGWSARYVSGYVFSGGNDVARIQALAMHAWVEVYRPGTGWIGLDATAGDYVDDRYVAVGKGRDYDDVRPVRGVLIGATSQNQTSRLVIARAPQQQ